MIVVRRAQLSDLDALMHLSHEVGVGMTTMPTDEASWRKKLAQTDSDFDKTIDEPNGEIYFMVLEDSEKSKVVGCCALYAGVGMQQPFYSYRLSRLTKSSEKLDITIHTDILHLVNDYMGCTELGSLFVLPKYRHDGVGKFLSRSRLMLLADFPERFNKRVFAELRGWLNEHDQSPFWENVTSKFFGISYQGADFISAIDGSQFISDLMPKHPLYLELLPKEARDVVGKAHKDAMGAMTILQREGLEYTGYLDVFDAGPCIQANVENVKSVSNSETVNIARIEEILDPNHVNNPQIISNRCLKNYRLVEQPVQFLSDKEIVISPSTAKALNVSQGQSVRIVGSVE